MSKINILFVHHATGWGGAPNSMLKLINKLNKEDFYVEVLLLKDSIVSRKLKEENINYKLAKSSFYRKFYTYFTYSEALTIKWFQFHYYLKAGVSWILSKYYFASRELKFHEFDIIHLNSSVLTDWLFPAKKSGAKVIIHIREPFKKRRYSFLYCLFRNQMKYYADKIIAISKDNANRIGLYDKTEVVYNYSEIPKIKSPEESYFSKQFLYLGGSDKYKGFYILTEALKFLNKDIKILFGGDYSKIAKNTSKHFVKNVFGLVSKDKKAYLLMKQNKNAKIIGLIDNVSEYLMKSCCLISPFTKPHFARPIIESFLYKKTAIASNVEGMDEIIQNDFNGLLVKANDAKALASAINSIAINPLKAKEMGENGYDIAMQKFSPSNIKSFISIYKSL